MTVSCRHIALLGVGLIGGSLGLAWKRGGSDRIITGYDRPEVLDQAEALGAVDRKAASVEAAVTEADVVVFATPLAAAMRLMEAAAPHLKPGALVTDVGSVKGPMSRHAAAVLPAANPFIGGHPMAGAEHGGVAHARAFLFENATYVLCPPPGIGEPLEARFPGFVDLIAETGGRVLVLDADRHDRIAATVSHLPQLLAVTLMNYAAGENEDDPFFLRLAAGGFRDLTRIAASPFDIWRDILPANHGAILEALGGFASALRRTRNRLIEENWDHLADAFTRARQARTGIPRDTKGFLHPLVDVYVFVADRPGALHAITGVLLDAGLSVKDIELLKIREGTGGTFRLAFSGPNDADEAVQALRNAGYEALLP